MNIHRISTDVLVVGSGAAGLRAALEARRAGVRVLLVSKGRTGLGNVTAVAGGGIVAPFGHADPRDNPDVYFEDTLASGRGLCDPELVRIFVNEACREILHLQQLGLAFRMEPDGRFVQLYQPGHSFPRDCKVAGPSRTESWVPTFEGGRLLSMSLKKAAAQIGVECLERTIVFDLCSDNLGIAGAIGVDETMNLIVIESKAVILATGGAGEVFKYNVTPPDMTGDGYRLALQKGVSLFDMEFVQFYPISIVEPGVPHWYLPYWYFFENGALLHNIKGEDVLVREGFTKIEEITRDKLARACGQDEVLLLDCTRMTDDVWKQHDFLAFKNEMLRHGFDPGDKPFKVTPTGYYFMGGIKIDASCRTSVPGLYAAGEVVGGIHGANRLGSNEFPAALVFGAIAGKSASEYTLTIPKMRIPADSVNSSREKIRQCLKAERTKVGHPVAVRAKIQETMWDYAIWVRSREGLERALKKLKNIKSEQMSSSYARTFSELKRLLENEALMDTAEMICWAAWMREESRGSHFRVDYPSEDPVWERNIFSTMTGNEVNLQLNSGEVSVHSGSRAP